MAFCVPSASRSRVVLLLRRSRGMVRRIESRKASTTSKNKKRKTVVDLRSDTMTRPCERMREAMRNANVGDDVWGEDPTVIDLERKVADMFGKESGESGGIFYAEVTRSPD